MQGIPKILKTAFDFNFAHEFARSQGTPEDKVKMREHWAGLLEWRFKYEFDRELVEGEQLSGPAPDFKLEVADGIRRQFIRVIDPAAPIEKLEFTSEQVEAKLFELSE